jgi:hypothetical protein
MNTLEFLTALWPRQGLYAIGKPYTFLSHDVDKTTGKRIWKTVLPVDVFDSIEEAAEHVDLIKGKHDVYYGTHAQIERMPTQKGQRKQVNMRASREFFFDLDCGDTKSYATQRDAARSVLDFSRTVGLPDPMLVSSGRGVHVHWRMEDEIPSNEWVETAHKLRLLAEHYAVKFDPSRTTDTASVLRVAGTFHRKDANDVRPVVVRSPGVEIATDDMVSRIDKAFASLGLNYQAPSTRTRAHDELGSNTGRIYDFPQSTIAEVEAACPQMARLIFNRGDVSEPEWYAALNVVRFVVDGEKLCHELFDGHPNYTPAETDAKLAQLEGYGPTTCDKLASVCGAANCSGCEYKDKVKAPIVAARYFVDRKPLEGPPPGAAPGLMTYTPEVQPPKPFARVQAGILMTKPKTKDKPEYDALISTYDIFPMDALARTELEKSKSIWCVNIPRVGQKVITITSTMLNEGRDLMAHLYDEGVFISPDHINDVRKFMVAYIKELQKAQVAHKQYDHLGWDNEFTEFVLPDRVLTEDGLSKPAILTQLASAADDYVRRRGTLQRQIELIDFYNHPRYVRHQFYLLCSLASIILWPTELNGLIVNASGKAGASKSTVLYTAASFWGHPKRYTLNGNSDGATRNARNDRLATLANLPVCMDEITEMSPEEARVFALGISQPGERLRLRADATVRKSRSGVKSTIALTTANTSLHGVLSLDNSAGTASSMRVFELMFPLVDPADKPQADAFLRELMQNYGHIGPAFAEFAVSNKDYTATQVIQRLGKIDRALQIEGGERFWSGGGAAALTAGDISKDLKLLHFNMPLIEEWLIEEHIPYMRGVVATEYSNYDPANILTNFIEHINGNIVKVSKNLPTGNLSTTFMPRGELSAHFDVDKRVLWVRNEAFKEYCRAKNRNMRLVLEELAKRFIVVERDAKRTLGLGTELAKGRTLCFVVNLAHPEVGELGAQMATNTNVVPLR